ncbi:hypothetical protein JTE90_001952 [Oedothorax gibbosus]|uniref:Kinetochore protein Nuf2 N-terminal domain-containing protein n=1 Tax=Oedothorax gibbosus TaxID=931172 RepID=A0AAV6VX67_9ARAC|nr:hypothetical protein JTE90_001952 [Oedothorax gibbosus]
MAVAGKLTDENIFQCLKTFNVPVRMSDINTPTRDFVIRVFECFLKDQQIDISSQNQRNFDSIKHMENPELCHEGTMLIQLVKYINKITRKNGLEITIRDIFEPKPKRTKRILNYLILFWNYLWQKNLIFQNVEQSYNEERRHVEQMLEEISELQRKKDECSSVLDAMEPSKEELESCVSSKTEKAAEFQKLHKGIMDEYEYVIKKKEKDLSEKISTLEVNVLSLKEQINEIEQLILPSPERLSTELQRTKDVIKNEDIKIREKVLQLKETKKSLDVANQTCEQSTKITEVLRDIKSALEEFSKLIDLFLCAYANFEKEEDQLKRNMAELENKDKLKNMIAEKEMKISLNTLKYKESMEETLISLKNKIANELKVLELLKLRKADIAQRSNKVSQSANEVVGFVKQAEDLSEKQESECLAQMEAIVAAYIQNCKEIKAHAKKTFWRG